MNTDLIDSAALNCFKVFRESSLFKMSSLCDIAYPRLTRLFYINMVVSKSRGGETNIKTLVKGKQIILNPSTLAQILKTTPDLWTDSHPPRQECVSKAREQYLLPDLPQARQLTHSSLKLEPKIIFTYLVRCIVPRITSRELVTDQTLEIIFLLLNGYALDLPNIILNHMVHCYSSPRRHTPLPYANLLPKIFEFFEIDLGNEEVERNRTPNIGMDTFNKIGIFCLPDGTWKLRSELSSDEMSALPPSMSKGKEKAPANPPLSSSRLDALESRLDGLHSRLDALEFCQDENRRDMMLEIQDQAKKLDQTHELLAIVNAKINQMFYLNALTYTATGSIMPLHEDAAQQAREKSANVLLNCVRSVKDRPILRPQQTEPTIITVEEYGVVKKYREAEEQRRIDEMMKDKVFAEAHGRWCKKARDDVRFKRSTR